MKKRGIITFIATALMVVSLAACSSGKKSQNLNITLDENPTTGYTWTYKIEDENVAKFVSDEYVAPKGDKAGEGGTHTYEFAGVKKGETTITFTLKRSWEENEAAQTKNVTVSVDDDNVIVEKK